MVNVLKFHSLDINFINVSYPYLLSSYFFLIYTYVNLLKIEIGLHNKLVLFHWRVTYLSRGVHPPWGNDVFPLCFTFPPVFEKNSNSEENFPNSIRQYFWWPYFSHQPQISNFLLFSLISIHFPSISRKLFFSLLFKIPSVLVNLRIFTHFLFFSFPPYFHHDAFMHHTMHVLDTPV